MIKGRRSIRRYQSDELNPGDLEQILTAACWAPSAHNRQPWRWIVVEQIQVKQDLAEAMGQALIRGRTEDGDDPELIDQDYQRSVRRITQAPVVVVACVDMSVLDRYPDDDRNQFEYLMAVQSVAMAGQNAMLLAHAIGLGSCWMCAPLFSGSEVRSVLDLPEAWVPQGLILFGRPAGPGKLRSRAPLGDIVTWK